MPKVVQTFALGLLAWTLVGMGAGLQASPSTLPRYDHIIVVVEENKDFEQILGTNSDAPYIRQLAAEGASISQMFGEEHASQGNYFWLFSGSNQSVGFFDEVPSVNNNSS